MSESDVVHGGMTFRRQFERSRLEKDPFEAVYDALLMGRAADESGAVVRSQSAAEVPQPARQTASVAA